VGFGYSEVRGTRFSLVTRNALGYESFSSVFFFIRTQKTSMCVVCQSE
jgi:hypothetical protein